MQNMNCKVYATLGLIYFGIFIIFAHAWSDPQFAIVYAAQPKQTQSIN